MIAADEHCSPVYNLELPSEISPLLEVKGLCKSFNRSTGFFSSPQIFKAVDNISLCLYRGETLGLVGESGCGKSTLARMLAGLLRPDAGEITLRGETLFSVEKSRSKYICKDRPKHIQMVFQDPYSSLNPRLSIGASIAEPLACANVSSNNQQKKVAELLQLVGLAPNVAKLYPHEFSGGQRQRIALARAIALNPEIVLCDEPVSSLDASVQAQVLNLLKDMQESLSLSYLFISHDLAVIRHMSDRVAVMYMGHIIELAKAEDFFNGPKHPYSRLLLASVPQRRKRHKQRGYYVKRADITGTPIADEAFQRQKFSGCSFYPLCPENMGGLCRDIVPQPVEISGASAGSTTLYTSKVCCHLYAN